MLSTFKEGRIYKITSRTSGKSYIGQTTTSVEQRFYEHCRPSSVYCRLLHRAIKKYGKEDFEVITISTCDSMEELNRLEEVEIKKQNTIKPNGYNLLPGGNNRKHHEETKRKMSKTRTGKRVPALSVPRGPMSEKQKQNISKAKKGRPNGLLGKKKGFIPHPKKRKPIMGQSRENNSTLRFGSIKEASIYFGCTHTNLVAHLKGRRLSWCNYIWKYE